MLTYSIDAPDNELRMDVHPDMRVDVFLIWTCYSKQWLEVGCASWFKL